MIYETKQRFSALTGSPLKDQENVEIVHGVVIANALIQAEKSQDPMKNWSLAQKFYKEDKVELDSSDVELIKTIIKASTFSNIIKAQVLENLVIEKKEPAAEVKEKE